MKRLFALCFSLLLFTITSTAQIYGGLRVGLNISDVVVNDPVDNSPNFDTKLGFVGGAYFNYQFHNLFAVQPEVYYTIKGAKLKDDYNDLTLKLSYVEIPVLLQFIIPLKDLPVKPIVFAGPSVGINLTSKAEYNDIGQTNDNKDKTKSTEISLVLGGGVSLPIGKNEIGADVRYILGLTNIDKTNSTSTIKNNIINFNLFYGFSL